MKDKGRIFKYDSDRKQWNVHFSARRGFSQFEILPDDRVAIVCPVSQPIATLPDSLAFMEMEASVDNEKVPLMEIYSVAQPSTPAKVIPFPKEVAGTLLLVNAHPLIDKTIQMNGQFLLLNTRAGQVFVYDSTDHSVLSLKVPWPSLTPEVLKDLDKLGMKPTGRNGVVKLSQWSFPVRIHLYPQNSREILFAVIMNPVCEPGYSRLRDAHEIPSGNRFAPVTKEYTVEENKNWSWMKYYRYDVAKRRFEELKNPKLSALRLDFAEHWLTLAGDAIPLNTLGLGGTDPGTVQALTLKTSNGAN
jgi:hypothetical protein